MRSLSTTDLKTSMQQPGWVSRRSTSPVTISCGDWSKLCTPRHDRFSVAFLSKTEIGSAPISWTGSLRGLLPLSFERHRAEMGERGVAALCGVVELDVV